MKISLKENIFTNNKVLRVSKDEILLQEGDPLDKIIIIIKGKLKFFILSKDGKKLTLHYLNPLDICLISVSCTLQSTSFPVWAEVVDENTEYQLISKNDFFKTLMNNQTILQQVLNSLSERIFYLINNIKDISFLSLRGRVAKYILTHQTNNICITTHQGIADELGSSREVISRALNYLSSNQLICSQRGVVKILNINDLTLLCD